MNRLPLVWLPLTHVISYENIIFYLFPLFRNTARAVRYSSSHEDLNAFIGQPIIPNVLIVLELR